MIYNSVSLLTPAFYVSPLHSTVGFPTTILAFLAGGGATHDFPPSHSSRGFLASATLSALTLPYTIEAGSAVIRAVTVCTHQLVSRAVIQLAYGGTIAALTGTVAAFTVSILLKIGLMGLSIVHLYINMRIVKWVVDGGLRKEYYQNLFLWARSYFGFANAGHFNAVNDKQVSYININMLKCLPISELINVDKRIINALPEHDKTEINNLLLTPEALARVEHINALAEKNEIITIDELNSLSAHEMQMLRLPVFLQIENQQGDLQRLSHKVLNNLSSLTLAELPVSVLLNLSPTTLQNLEPRVLNGSSFELERCLPARIKQQLSVIPIRWDGREILDIATPNIANNVKNYRRLYWIQNDGNHREAAPAE